MKESITDEFLNNSFNRFKDNINNKVLMDAISKNGIDAASINNQVIAKDQHAFSIDIDAGKVTDQKKSGRCWMFAGLNIIRQGIIEKYKIKDFELSECYLMFWDKLEKANLFLENIISTVDETIDSRIVTIFLKLPVPDGGDWGLFCNLVKKYGVMPKYSMLETFHSSNSEKMNALLNSKLREGALKIREIHDENGTSEEMRHEKEDILNAIFSMLCRFLGEPPKRFDFEYRDTDKKFFGYENITPVEFFNKFVGIDVDEYVSVINAPTRDKKFGVLYQIPYYGNVVEAGYMTYLNVDIGTMKDLAIKQLKDNEEVWFGCDVTKMSNRELGVMDSSLYDYDLALGTDIIIPKGEKLDYRDSSPTHAMALTGVNLVNDRPNRWKVENSWGEKNGKDGYFVMDDSWFDEYTYEVIINKKYLSDKLKAALEKEPIKLKPWDPICSFAVLK
ncbi:MAG: C1 family peptidase [Clostridiales bacterium]|nr:C1 family peptidase [Clostridiales bacterium]